MSKTKCQGDGAGWGTVEGTTLKVLLLASHERQAEAEAWARAIGLGHEVNVLSGGSRGPGAWLAAARAGKSLSPHLVHALGFGGYAASAGSVAAGLSVPLVLTLARSELQGSSLKKATRWSKKADAVLLASEESAEILRQARVSRDLYILSPPTTREDDPFVIGALEIVYGRILARAGVDLEDEGRSFRVDHPPDRTPELVQIGALARRRD